MRAVGKDMITFPSLRLSPSEAWEGKVNGDQVFVVFPSLRLTLGNTTINRALPAQPNRYVVSFGKHIHRSVGVDGVSFPWAQPNQPSVGEKKPKIPVFFLNGIFVWMALL